MRTKCEAVSLLCQQYDQNTGECLSCVSSFYNLQNGACVVLASIVAGCERYEGPYCADCIEGYIFQAYTCVKIDPDCIQYNN